MGERLNQHQLARRLCRSRMSIIAWQREGLPFLEAGGHGRAKLYDLDAVLAWLQRTGRGMRPDLPAIAMSAPALAPASPAPASQQAPTQVQTSAFRLQTPDVLLGWLLARAAVGLAALALERGLAGEAALELVDEFIVVAYDVLEEHLGREALIPLDGEIAMLLNDDGRALLLERAQRIAEQLAEERKRSTDLGA